MTSADREDEVQNERDLISLRAELELKNNEELFLLTLEGDYEDDGPWEAVQVLRGRGTCDVFELAKRYSLMENSKPRARGLSVLAQLGGGKPDSERPFIGESVSIAINHLQDQDRQVVRCAAWALSHLGTPQAVESLISLRHHADADVRQAIACCIPLRAHPDAISVLVELTNDISEAVRDWATFSLGSGDLKDDGTMSYKDCAEIRAALSKRLNDSYEDARHEAIWGLAFRRDPRGLKLLLEALESDHWWSGDEQAAEELLGLPANTPIADLCNGLRRLLA